MSQNGRRPSLTRVNTQRLLEGAYGLVKLALIGQRQPQVVHCLGVVGLQPYGLPQHHGRRSRLAGFAQRQDAVGSTQGRGCG